MAPGLLFVGKPGRIRTRGEGVGGRKTLVPWKSPKKSVADRTIIRGEWGIKGSEQEGRRPKLGQVVKMRDPQSVLGAADMAFQEEIG
jgi:hypothetical protein